MRSTVLLLALASTLALACKGKDKHQDRGSSVERPCSAGRAGQHSHRRGRHRFKEFSLTAGSDPSAPSLSSNLLPLGAKNEPSPSPRPACTAPPISVAQTAPRLLSFPDKPTAPKLFLRWRLREKCCPVRRLHLRRRTFGNQPIAHPQLAAVHPQPGHWSPAGRGAVSRQRQRGNHWHGRERRHGGRRLWAASGGKRPARWPQVGWSGPGESLVRSGVGTGRECGSTAEAVAR